MKAGIEKRIGALIGSIMRVDATTVDGNSSAATVPTWDSLNHMKLVLALEEEFRVSFSEEQIVQMTVVHNIISILETSLAQST